MGNSFTVGHDSVYIPITQWPGHDPGVEIKAVRFTMTAVKLIHAYTFLGGICALFKSSWPVESLIAW